ncbi:MAG: hypothetical protein ABR975_07110 [Vulcanimicrobiaceae bacterium]
MKRALAALVMLGIATVTAAPSMAATTVYGSAQIKYTINATAQVAIATNYTSTAPYGQSAGAATILASTAGNCAAGVAETGATLTFGAITPGSSATTYTSCLYKNALLVGVNSNDSTGFKVWEYTDTVASGTVICAYANNTATMAASPVASPATAIAGNGTCAAPTGGAAGTALTSQGRLRCRVQPRHGHLGCHRYPDGHAGRRRGRQHLQPYLGRGHVALRRRGHLVQRELDGRVVVEHADERRHHRGHSELVRGARD